MSFVSMNEDSVDSWNERDHLFTGRMPCSPMDRLTNDQAGKETEIPTDQDNPAERPPLR